MADSLNPPQREAVNTLAGPLLVLAGAGTGKTRVVTFRIARLISKGTPPERILAVTFTNKAAREMRYRVKGLLKKVSGSPEVSTFHSLCLKILRRHAKVLGYPAKFAIYDRGDQEGIARGVLREIRVPDTVLRPGDLLNIISRWKSSAVRPKEAGRLAASDKEHLAASGYRRYQNALKTAGAVDFDDLLLLTEDLFSGHEEIRRQEAARFDHILIDEYQDTNSSQYRIIKALACGHKNLCVVGDDDQSIYAWRGAEVQHILRFAGDWPGAKMVRLEDNYRSTAEILDFANRLIAFNKVRHHKVLRAARSGGERPAITQYQNETKEAEGVVADIVRRAAREPGVELKDFAVLFRTNEQPRAFETEFRKAKVPYILLGSSSFFDRKEVKDVLSYLKILDNPQDEVSLLRIINCPPRGLGDKSVQTLKSAAVKSGTTVWDSLQQSTLLSGPAAAAANTFMRTIEEFRRRLEKESPVDVARDLVAKINYRGEIERTFPEETDRLARWNSVEEVINALGSHFEQNPESTISNFLDETALADRDFESDKESKLNRNAVALMTLHSAKGLEFPFVYMVGMEEGFLPHARSVAADDESIDEERRLCYVGITRAQERLTLSLALSRMKWGKPRESIPSRFLYEMTGKAQNVHNRGRRQQSAR